jgi:hypothetical protein
MRIEKSLLLLTVLICQQLAAQTGYKFTGPLCVYDMSAGYCYSDSTSVDSVDIESLFRFGEFGIPNQAVYAGHNFQSAIDTVNQWHANRIFAIIQPTTEHGVYNQPLDTALYAPYLITKGPGMIQGGQRFSRLSQLYSGFSGAIMDDWNGDTSITRQVRDALLGKPVDAAGNVCSECMPTTPGNKLYTVLYHADAIPSAMPVLDGVIYSIFDQNCCYQTMDSDITQLEASFQHKDRMIAIFMGNTAIGGWATDTSVQYLLAHTLDRYDDGDINGVIIFAATYLLKKNITIGLWNGFDLPHWLDSLYYPYLGGAGGDVYDCDGHVLSNAAVRVYCQSKSTGDTLMRSYQLTDNNGYYQFGLWAGNRNTDSTYYWLIAESPGYLTDTVGFWIKREETANLPRIDLCPGINGSKSAMLLYPNPSTGLMTLKVDAYAIVPGTQIDVYDMLGRKVYSAPVSGAISTIDFSTLHDGIYQVSVSQSWGWFSISQSRIVIRH